MANNIHIETHIPLIENLGNSLTSKEVNLHQSRSIDETKPLRKHSTHLFFEKRTIDQVPIDYLPSKDIKELNNLKTGESICLEIFTHTEKPLTEFVPKQEVAVNPYSGWNLYYKVKDIISSGVEKIKDVFGSLDNNTIAIIGATAIVSITLIATGVSKALIPEAVKRAFELAGTGLSKFDTINRYLDRNFVVPSVEVIYDYSAEAVGNIIKFGCAPFLGDITAKLLGGGVSGVGIAMRKLSGLVYHHVACPLEDLVKDRLAYPIAVQLLGYTGLAIGSNPIVITLLTIAISYLLSKAIIAVADIAKYGIMALIEKYYSKDDLLAISSNLTAENIA